MGKQWMSCVALVGALALGPAVEGKKKISIKLLEEAKAKVAHIEGLIASAQKGDAEAQYDLGVMISNEGPKYIRRTSDGFDPAPYKEVDATALDWTLRAARQGHEMALWRLPILYRGTGDLVQAYAWNIVFLRQSNKKHHIVYDGGVETTRGALLREKMTDDQVAEAERLSYEIEREIKGRSGEKAR